MSYLVFVCATAVQTAQAVDISTQRQYYDEAKRALAKGDSGPYFRYSQALRDYPLEPYLAYDELTARLKSASNAEIEKFLAEHGDLPQANWMKLRWLRWLAERGDWATFVKYYDPKLNFTELDCLNAQYQLGHGLKAEGYANTEKLWLTGKSQPAACDALFGMWAAQGQLTEQKRWERAKLAAQARNYPLANSLISGLTTLAPRQAAGRCCAKARDARPAFALLARRRADVRCGQPRSAPPGPPGRKKPWPCWTAMQAPCIFPGMKKSPLPVRSG